MEDKPANVKVREKSAWSVLEKIFDLMYLIIFFKHAFFRLLECPSVSPRLGSSR